MTKLLYKLDDIVRVSKKICETGEVRIWGIDESPPHPSMLGNWDYCAHSWDSIEQKIFGNSFYLKEEEILELIVEDVAGTGN